MHPLPELDGQFGAGGRFGGAARVSVAALVSQIRRSFWCPFWIQFIFSREKARALKRAARLGAGLAGEEGHGRLFWKKYGKEGAFPASLS
jgi:hypothetical protein